MGKKRVRISDGSICPHVLSFFLSWRWGIFFQRVGRESLLCFFVNNMRGVVDDNIRGVVNNTREALLSDGFDWVTEE